MNSPLTQQQVTSRLNLPRLQSLDDTDLPGLQRIFDLAGSPDPYSRSAGYFAMTGRSGLWLYGDDQNMLVLARHPNRDDAILAFPPLGSEGATLIPSLLADPRMSGEQILLARFSNAATGDLARVVHDAHHWRQEEQVMDWRYPVHVLDTATVATHAGHAFRDFRKNIFRAERAGLTTHPLDPAKDRAAILMIAKAWTSIHEMNGDDETFTAPVLRVLDLAERTELPIMGVGVMKEGSLVGYSIWEESDRKRSIANGLVNASLPGIKGIAELSYLAACRALTAKGFRHFCIGGSETEGLDAFKRKMNPAYSVELSTLNPALNAMPKSGRHNVQFGVAT